MKMKAYNILALIDQIQTQKYFPIKKNRKGFGFDGIQTYDLRHKIFLN